jgi:PPOX class probable F420-dependent enzyme
VCLLVDEYDEDWSKLWWVRLDGHGRLVDDRAEDAAARAALAAKYPQYVERPPAGPVVAVTVTHWSAWSAAKESASPAG